MSKLYLVLTHTGTLFSRTIRLYTRSKYTHVSLSLHPNLDTLYSFGRKKTHNPFIGGFVTERRNQGVYLHCRNTLCEVYEIEVDEFKYYQVQNIIAGFKLRQDNLKYNTLGLITMLFGRGYRRQNYYFCSQFVAEVLEQAGIIKFNKPPYLVKPGDFWAKKEQFTLIYRGLLRKYNEQSLNLIYHNTIKNPL